jgi:DNA-binding response OmpR family regulator
MTIDATKKRVLVLSDDDRLSRAIALNLTNPQVEIARFIVNKGNGCQRRAALGDYDLIVMAMSSPGSEPVVALSRAALGGRIGQVPLLIISDRPFDSDVDNKITHLDFPFDANHLGRVVEDILEAV